MLSGKGGTGKTSIVASLALLAGNAVVADCDVDAPDLHLILKPRERERHDFISGHEAVIRPEDCTGCGECAEACRFDAIFEREREGRVVYEVDPQGCEGCGVCVRVCPVGAIDFPDRHCGHWMISDSRGGPMVHAQLTAAAENSGKLVSTVRTEARRVAEESGRDLIIVDGPPGIGCPAISAVTQASLVLVVAEPTLSGLHDMKRVLDLAAHFKIPSAVCVNRWDLNPTLTERVEQEASQHGASLAGRVSYDPGVTRAQMDGLAPTETDTKAAPEIAALWAKLGHLLGL